jgi:hypothetical protein
LFIEAKALGGDLTDRRWSHQIMAYAVVAGVEWVVLTNGDEYRIYNAHAPVPVEDKMFRVVHVTDTEPSVEETLDLLSKGQLQRRQIEALWSAHFVDRQIRPVIEGLFSPAPDASLINLVRKRLPNLSPTTSNKDCIGFGFGQTRDLNPHRRKDLQPTKHQRTWDPRCRLLAKEYLSRI